MPMNNIVKIFLLSSLLLFSNLSIGQNLTLSNLEKIMSNSEWSYSDNFLAENGWVYTGFDKTSVGEKITWAYKYDRYDKVANAWLSLYLVDDKPSSLEYRVFNLESSNLVNKRIGSSGYISERNKLADNRLMKGYSKGNILLVASSYYNSDDGSTDYEYNLVRKGGHYDSRNGKKMEYSSEAGGWIEYTMRNGEMQGPFVIYFSKGGSVKMKSYFQKGKPNGNTIEYYKDGQVSKKYLMKNGNKTGLEIQYYSNGKIKRKCNYSNGLQNGKTIEYDETGQIEEVYFQKDGEIGLVQVFENGKLSVEMNLSNGKKNGTYTSYDSEGRINVQGDYINGLENGVWESFIFFDESGEIGKIYKEYKEGKKEGKFHKALIIDKHEQVLSEMYYKNDKLSGLGLSFKGDSIIASNFFAGELNGPSKTYLCPEDYLKTDVNEIDLQKLILLRDGQYMYTRKNGTWRYYSRNNINQGAARQPYLTQTFANNKLYGAWEDRDSLGNIVAEGFYSDNEQQGVWRYYEYNGNQEQTSILKVSYENGVKRGLTELYYGDKHIYTGSYNSHGNKNGYWIQNITHADFDSRDNIYQKCTYSNGKLHGESSYVCDDEILNTETYSFDKLIGYCTYYNFSIRSLEKYYGLRNFDLRSIFLFDSLGINRVTSFGYAQKKEYVQTDFYGEYSTEQTYKRGDKFDVVWKNIEKSKNPSAGLELEKVISSDESVKHGDFIKIATNNYPYDNDTLIIGIYNKNVKDGVWTFFYPEQSLKITKIYSDGVFTAPEKYLNLNGSVFNGKYTEIRLSRQTKELISIKDGLRNGKSIVYSLTDNQVLSKVKYKKGVKK
jgi:antitoxin component YwqK of YwqJK toxin-antitoxin module